MVLQVLREHQLYAKLSKYIFYQMEINYLGHIISKEGISIDIEKIEAIRVWSTPNNVTEVRSFTGLAGYYRRFIEDFSKIANPITSLQKKGVKFEWTFGCEESFQQLINILTSAPILKIEDPDEYFVVCIDACKRGISGVLMKNGHVVCYESIKLNEHEGNYATRDLKMAAIIYASNMWRHYLMGKIFE
jgi:hypothetical protein